MATEAAVFLVLTKIMTFRSRIRVDVIEVGVRVGVGVGVRLGVRVYTR